MSARTALAVLAALGLANGTGAPARAQAAPITLYIPLHHTVVAVVGATQKPSVRVLYPDGGIRAVPVSTTQMADGNWLASFNLPTTLTGRMLLAPGDIVEADDGGPPVRATVPEFFASADAATGVVRGSARGFVAVGVQPHHDADWYPGTADPTAVLAAVKADGDFEAPLADRFHFGPGTWGEAYVQDTAGNLFVTEFAPAYATAYWDQPLIALRADPTLAPSMISRDAQGGVSFRIQALPYEGSLFFVPLFDPNDPEQIPQPLAPGDSLAAVAGERTLFEETLTRVTAGIDRPADSAEGGTAPQASVQVKVRLEPAGAPTASGTVTAGADGAWKFSFDAANLGAQAEVEVLSVTGGAVAHHTTGHTLGFSASLYGHRLAGTLRGRGGTVGLTYTHSDGIVTTGSGAMDGLGRFDVELFRPGGEPDRVAPGGVTAVPEWGPVENGNVPRVTAQVAAGLRIIEGEAPPYAAVAARVYTTTVDLFLAQPYDRPYIEVTGRADASGHYRLTCAATDCAANYGYLDADTGNFVARLQWVAAPLSEMDVTRGVLRGYATAGEAVSVKLGSDFTRFAQSAPPLGRGLPDWTVDASGVFTSGLPVGTPLHLDVAGAPLDLTVPPLTWQPDTAADRIDGTGPPGRVLYVVAVPPTGDASRSPAVAAVTVGARGVWQASFPGFDLRSGDGLELLMPYPSLVARWFQDAVPGNDPPTPTPKPASWRALLPSLRHP